MKNFTEKYYATTEGNIISRYTGKTLRPFTRKDGYKTVKLVDPKTHKGYTINVHRFVAYCLVDGYEEGKVVNHKNGDRGDNRVTNLEWVTQRENIQHAKEVLGTRDYSGEKHPMYGKKQSLEARKKMSEAKKGRNGKLHPRSKAVIATNLKTGEKLSFESQGIASKELKVSQGNIAMCISGKRKSTGGYAWELSEIKM